MSFRLTISNSQWNRNFLMNGRMGGGGGVKARQGLVHHVQSC